MLLKFGTWYAELRMWTGLLLPLRDLDECKLYSPFLLVTGALFDLSLRPVEVKLAKRTFSISTASCTIIFIVTGMKGAFLYSRLRSYQIAFYPSRVTERLAKTLGMKKVIIPLDSVLIGHCYPQRADEAYRGACCLQYHVYLIPKEMWLKYAIAWVEKHPE